MPKFAKIFIVLFLFLSLALAGLSGEYTVGTLGTYTTLTAALTAWRDSTITGHVTFRLLDATYPAETYPLVCTNPAGYSPPESAWTLTIKPATGVTPTITDTNHTAIFDLTGINRLTIDSLTIINTLAASSASTVRFIGGASFNTIKNSTLKGCKTGATGGIVTFSTAGVTGNNNNTIENCQITSGPTLATDGIYFTGNASPLDNQFNTIKKCNIYDINGYHILLAGYTTNTTITECDIYSVSQMTRHLCGISISSTTVGKTMITRNKIHDFWTSQTDPNLRGIWFNSSHPTYTNTAANNFIYLDAKPTRTHPTAQIWGIEDPGSTTTTLCDVYYNSVYIGGTAATDNSYCFQHRSLVGTIFNIKNNIFFNNRTGASSAAKQYAIYSGTASALITSDYNDLYVSTPGANYQYVGYWGTDCATLAAWQTASGRDSNSISLNPNFVSTDPGDLHINPNSTNVNGKATPIGTITNDFDGDTRHPTTPDIGADEYTPVSIEEEMPNLWSEEKPKVLSPFFNEKISIRLTNSIKSPCRITLYNAFGRIVYEALHSTTTSFVILDDKGISNLTQGVYFLTIEQHKRTVMVTKLIKL